MGGELYKRCRAICNSVLISSQGCLGGIPSLPVFCFVLGTNSANMELFFSVTGDGQWIG